MPTPTDRRPLRLPRRDDAAFVAEVLRRETVGGVLALLAAGCALVWANTAGDSYEALRRLQLGPLDLEHWAAEGALAVFFLVAGLELKRELVVGSLRRPADAAVPVAAAVGGVLVPAVVFVVVNLGSPDLRGWAIPSATDIAFALAVLAVVGSGLPQQLRAFLLTLAVVDDLVVVAIIAVFYSSSLHVGWLIVAVAALATYGLLQRWRLTSPWLLTPLVVLAWWATYAGGVHATVAGVVVGLLTRVATEQEDKLSPAERLEQALSPVSACVAVPLFALTSTGVPLGGLSLVSPVALGVVAGLVVGKPVGVLGGAWLAGRIGGRGPGLAWRDLVGLALLCGIGFTVALLVCDLSYDDARAAQAKSAVLVGSLLAALLGAVALRRRSRLRLG
ncbi:Na+/H+ antiporter NhaA [Nocardioides mangrovicus]|uniref:Na(+)/H(+) antiporter NhaA n=1 Tax=Nocardioides mangrovicus TaxID=2478913 RepID=A0A3L8NZ23_9ACTN|nr:Na+/H+ antiporter NhaA [Nocardioides mangrovicus]RLV48456.1 Na+/H+ antiporter NhaA [Nocardioides mangrovicus]